MLDVQAPAAEEKPIPLVKGLPLIGNVRRFQSDRLGFLMDVARECGELGSFRLGPVRVLLANSAQLAHTILNEKAARFENGKRSSIIEPVVGPSSLVVVEGAYHRKQRRLIAPAFQHKRVLGYTTTMVDYAESLQRSWRDGATIDLDREMTRLTHRIIMKTMFDRDVEGGAEDASDELSEALSVALQYTEYLNSSIFPLPLGVPTLRNRRTRKAIATVRRFVSALIEARRREGKDHGDLLSMLLLSRDEEGTTLSDAEILDHAVTMYVAGHETSARALTWLFITLARYPKVAAQVREEADSVLQGRKPAYSDLLRLTYTLRVIKETLRLLPPAYFTGRAPLEDVELGPYRVRKGEFILISPYTLHRDPTSFPDPERFDPDRFQPDMERRLPRGAYLPFGAGPHVCIGAQFAMAEIHLALSHLVQHVELAIAPGQDIRPVPQVVLKPSSARMIVRRRTPA